MSRRTLPTKRSAIAFARGARAGVLMTLMPSVKKNLVEASGELRVSVPDKEPDRSGPVGEVQVQVPGLLGDQVPRWVGGHA